MHRQTMIELRERLLHARSNKEKNQILDELHKLYTENPEDAKDFLNSTAVEFGAAAHSMAAKKGTCQDPENRAGKLYRQRVFRKVRRMVQPAPERPRHQQQPGVLLAR